MGGAAKAAATGPCGHVYCRECWDKVAGADARAPGKCPVCRVPVTAQDVRQLYM